MPFARAGFRAVIHALQAEQDPLLPIPVATEKRADPRLALTIGVAGWIANPSDFGKLHVITTMTSKC